MSDDGSFHDLIDSFRQQQPGPSRGRMPVVRAGDRESGPEHDTNNAGNAAADEDDDDDDDDDDDELDRRMVALGFAAYQHEGQDPPMLDTTDHEATAVPSTFADPLECVSQDEIDSSVYDLNSTIQESREEYDGQRLSKIHLSELKRWYETKDAAAAMNSLHGKRTLHIDQEFLMSTDDPNFVFGRPEVRLDCKIVVGLRLGLDPALPNMRAPGVAIDPGWRFTLRPDLRFFEYSGDRKPIGMDPQGRMVYLGLTQSAEDTWLLAAPRDAVGRTPVSNLSFAEGPTKMSARDVRVAMSLLAWMLCKSEFGAMVMYPEYPAIDSDATFGQSCDMLTRKSEVLTLEQFKKLSVAFTRNFETWWHDAPDEYRKGVWANAVPIIVITKFGQNVAIASPQEEEERRHWHAERDYGSVARVTLALAFHYLGCEVDHWEEIPVDEIREEHEAIYTSADHDNRELIDNLASHPLLTEGGCEIAIYNDLGVRIPRRLAHTSPASGSSTESDDSDDEAEDATPSCGLYQDLRRTHELFRGQLGPIPYYTPAAGDDSDSDSEPTQYTANYNVPYHVYPQFYSKYIGQWQADGLIKAMEFHLRNFEVTLRADRRAGRSITAVKSQCYNTLSHLTRESARQHLAQQGAATGTAAGAWASNNRTKTTAKTMFSKVRHELPHKRLARQISRAERTYMRHEVVLTFELLNMKPELRTGGALHTEVIVRVVNEVGGHADVVNSLKSTTIVVRRPAFPLMYLWCTVAVTATMTAVWNNHLLPVLKTSPAADGARFEPEDAADIRRAALARSRQAGVVPLSRPHGLAAQRGPAQAATPVFPPAQYLETIAVLERALNFAHTGAARVLDHGLMARLWTSLALVEHGYPMLNFKLVSFGGPQRDLPHVDIKRWPVDPVHNWPLVSSRRAQQLTYGEQHYQAYFTHFRVQTITAHVHMRQVQNAGGPTAQKLGILSDMVIDAYATDVQTFCKEDFHQWNDPAVEAGPDTVWARVRRTEFWRWEDAKFSLGWGDVQGSNFDRLARMLAESEADIHKGLPESATPTASIEDIAAAFYKMGSAKNRKGVRAPLWPKGNCYFILNAAIQEAHVVLSHLPASSRNVTTLRSRYGFL